MQPTLAIPVCQLCTEAQFAEPLYAYWCERMAAQPIMHRKQWEFVYIAQVLGMHGLLEPGKQGIGFGVGREPLPALFAAHGVNVLATDMPDAETGGWAKAGQHANDIEQLPCEGICQKEQFRRLVAFEPVDMNAISLSLRGFDFAWSACSLDHLGTLAHGLDFIRNSLECVKPGGVVVHTTEFNLSSDTYTLTDGWVVLYRDRDLRAFADEMVAQGHTMELNLTRGNGPLDGIADKQPYSLPHLSLQINSFVTTSVGLTIVKGGD